MSYVRVVVEGPPPPASRVKDPNHYTSVIPTRSVSVLVKLVLQCFQRERVAGHCH